MSSLRSDTAEEPAPEGPVPGQELTSAFLAQRFTGPLTVVNGHAQLIRRRAKGLDGHDAVALERSLDAIQLAVRQMVDVLIASPGQDAGETVSDMTNREPS